WARNRPFRPVQNESLGHAETDSPSNPTKKDTRANFWSSGWEQAARWDWGNRQNGPIKRKGVPVTVHKSSPCWCVVHYVMQSMQLGTEGSSSCVIEGRLFCAAVGATKCAVLKNSLPRTEHQPTLKACLINAGWSRDHDPAQCTFSLNSRLVVLRGGFLVLLFCVSPSFHGIMHSLLLTQWTHQMGGIICFFNCRGRSVRPSLFGSSRPSLFGPSRPSLFGLSRPSLLGLSRPSLLGSSRPNTRSTDTVEATSSGFRDHLSGSFEPGTRVSWWETGSRLLRRLVRSRDAIEAVANLGGGMKSNGIVGLVVVGTSYSGSCGNFRPLSETVSPRPQPCCFPDSDHELAALLRMLRPHPQSALSLAASLGNSLQTSPWQHGQSLSCRLYFGRRPWLVVPSLPLPPAEASRAFTGSLPRPDFVHSGPVLFRHPHLMPHVNPEACMCVGTGG
ncbi:unnamed protein product, partial [Protopolystoma xenopodis]